MVGLYVGSFVGDVGDFVVIINGDGASSGQCPVHSNDRAFDVSISPKSSHAADPPTHCNRQSPVPHSIFVSALHESSPEQFIVTSVAEFALMVVPD